MSSQVEFELDVIRMCECGFNLITCAIASIIVDVFPVPEGMSKVQNVIFI